MSVEVKGDMQHSESTGLQTELRNLDAEVSRVQALLKELVDKRTHIQRKLNDLTSPALKLPPEISSQIFTTYMRQGVQISNSLSPFLLGKVCSKWRDLAWSMPWLWSSVSMDFERNPPGVYASLLDEWLSRSGQRPLLIYIKGHSTLDDQTAILEIMGVISRFSERWRRIDFDLLPCFYEALSPVQGRVPILKSISLRLLYSDSTHYIGIFYMFSIAPQLRVVKVVDFSTGTLIFPTTRLTTFMTDSSNVQHCRKFLAVNPRLVNCKFKLEPSPPLMGFVPPVTAPRVQTLALHLSDGRVPISSLLHSLSIPAVRHLSFTAQGSPIVPFPFVTLVSLISRSGCLLQSLSLVAFMLADDELLTCLKTIPSLVDLKLLCHGISGHTIAMLNPWSASVSTHNPLLPNLQILHITCSTLVLDCTELYDMLSARWRPAVSGADYPIAKLQSVAIKAREATVTPPPIESLNQLVGEGMQISLVFGDSVSI